MDLVWFLDGDAFMADPATLKHLLEKGHPISAPLLTSTGPYSNFWAGMSPRESIQYHEIIFWGIFRHFWVIF